MRVGSTRRWRRGQIPRARCRDQRFDAGTNGILAEAWLLLGLCMGKSAGYEDSTSLSGEWRSYKEG